MPNLNTKNLKYNILNREADHSYWILSTIVSGIFVLFLAVIPGTQEILQIKNIKNLIEPAIIQPVSIFVLWLLVIINTEPKCCLYLWAQNRDFERVVISKSELFTNILSDDCEFLGYVYRPIENNCISKSCIKVPLTNEEYEQIVMHLEKDKEHEKKCMNPDVTVKK